MKQAYPKILPWLATKAGLSERAAQKLWIAALRAASAESATIESPEYWRAAVDHLIAKIAAESSRRRAAPFGWGSLLRLPASQWLHGLTTAEALFSIALRSAPTAQRRPCH